MKIRLKDLKRIIAEEGEGAKAQLGMAPSTSINPYQTQLWRDKEQKSVAKHGQAAASSKAEEKEALKQRILALRKATAEAEARYRELSRGLPEENTVVAEEYWADDLSNIMDPGGDTDPDSLSRRFPGAVEKLADLEGFRGDATKLTKYFDFDNGDKNELIAYEKGSPRMYVWYPQKKTWVEE